MINPETTSTRSPTTPIRLPGVASTAIHGVLSGSGTEAGVLGVFEDSAWILAGEQTIAITMGSARLPNGIQVPADGRDEVLARVRPDSNVLVGHGRLVVDGLSLTASQWWDPHPRPPATTVDDLATRLGDLPFSIPDIESSKLQTALEVLSAGGILHSARALLAKGMGVTPEGDDLLTGALAATRVLGEAAGLERLVSLIAGVSLPLMELATARTNQFSVPLIGMALRGQVVEPAGALLCALAGQGDVRTTHLGLIRFDHTSGPAIAAGIVLGAKALVTSQRRT
jgi:hypothetical protein